jgi:fatty-acid desaturase
VIERAIEPEAPSAWRRLATLRWHNIVMILVVHAAACLGFFYHDWSALVVCAVLYVWSACLGLTLGWHRLLSHGAFKAQPLLRLFLAASGCLALQNGPIEWVGVHRVHHAHTDQDEDPHTPLVQLAWAHIGWIFSPLPFDPREFARDLERDRGIAIIDRCHWLFSIALAAALYFLGQWWNGVGLDWLIWGMAVRVVLVFHATWFVNSAAHKWGYRTLAACGESAASPKPLPASVGQGAVAPLYSKESTASDGDAAIRERGRLQAA